MSDSSDTILRHATDSESARDVAAAHAAIVHAARRDSTATETRHEPSAVTAEARHEAATETRHGVPAWRGLRAAATADSASYSHQLGYEAKEKLGPRGQYGGVGWYQVLGKHGAIVRSAAALDSEFVCEVKEGSRLLVSSNCLVDALCTHSPKTVAQVRTKPRPCIRLRFG